MRNIKFAVSTARPVPFDELVGPAEQQAFLAGADMTAGDWQPLDELTRLQAKKFSRFCAPPRVRSQSSWRGSLCHA